ncbi:predicted protein [Plenodomus lingam JN3]|uniref:Predicted protein n=1 Tax=Leptosphaeria maculans (strain JN3 / isolate v23.1.3 / race Av1-4-5-6-7-8) TaxID=985895 RepID=E4ZJ15_LEPMJ|nr:predicted protein [Plenodomus lingam JN3]CBX91446.1 predicted protein [Plenodomus lingam JN3]
MCVYVCSIGEDLRLLRVPPGGEGGCEKILLQFSTIHTSLFSPLSSPLLSSYFLSSSLGRKGRKRAADKQSA